MAARALPQAEIDRLAAEGAAQLRRERAASAPKVINNEAALQLGEPIPLVWDGTTYAVRSISYRDGLQIQRAQLWIEQMAQNPATTPEEVEDAEAELIQALVLMHSLLADPPEQNPFVDASPAEVGALLGFFSASLTMQSGRCRLRAGGARSTIN